MLEYRTQGFNGYAVKYSPFFDSRIAVASSANFGLVGNGRLYILNLTPQGTITAERTFDTQDALYDIAWSEAHANQVLVGVGDSSVKLFDISTNEAYPIRSWHEHKREVYSVHWNLVEKTTFSSSSWDGTIKIWSPEREESLITLPTHSCTYSAAWSPHHPALISAVSSDSHLRLFDLRTPASSLNHLTLTIPVHEGSGSDGAPGQGASWEPAECLTHDWNRYRDTVVAVAGVDTLVRTFDIRSARSGGTTAAARPRSPLLSVFQGHRYAVRKVCWSPHAADILLSASYDMSCRIWQDSFAANVVHQPTMSPAQVGIMDRHTEFVTGVDWSMFGNEGWAASVGWDERVCVWNSLELIKPI